MIQLKHISKTYRVSKREAGTFAALKNLVHRNTETVHALRDISFSVKPGEIVGYIGPNGAGKSSTIKIMSGILVPDGGECLINGKTPWKDRKAHVKDIGVVFGQRSQLWWDIPVIDSYELFKAVYEIPDGTYKRNLVSLTELLHLEELLKTPVRMLSLGQRMRCEIAASLLHNPAILFLDEPTIGLDAVSKIAVRDFIMRLNKEMKTTVILTTHDMQDIEALTKRVVLIGKGEILMDGHLSDLRQRYGRRKKIVVHYHEGHFTDTEGIHILSNEHNHVISSVDTDLIKVNHAIEHLCKDAVISDVAIQEASVEEIISSLYREYDI
ncbi:MAG: ATP-binding cassette domain-containing protein [Clostridia bacterium]|nr:ATP-binding cassette domain-containing protein [Clostridia bacterium]